jgi:hypothetical protein
MVHGLEAVLPTYFDYGSPRVRAYTEENNQAALKDAIDQLYEARDVVLLRCAKYQQALRRYHKHNVRPRKFYVTLYSDEFKAARTRTSYHHLGRGRSSSTKCSDLRHTRSSMRTRESSPTHRTSSTCACFILE